MWQSRHHAQHPAGVPGSLAAEFTARCELVRVEGRRPGPASGSGPRGGWTCGSEEAAVWMDESPSVPNHRPPSAVLREGEVTPVAGLRRVCGTEAGGRRCLSFPMCGFEHRERGRPRRPPTGLPRMTGGVLPRGHKVVNTLCKHRAVHHGKPVTPCVPTYGKSVYRGRLHGS